MSPKPVGGMGKVGLFEVGGFSVQLATRPGCIELLSWIIEVCLPPVGGVGRGVWGRVTIIPLTCAADYSSQMPCSSLRS